MNDSSRGGTFEREVQAMGDAEELKDPKSESPISTPEPRENRSPDKEQEPQSAATSGSPSKPSVRRSSIRPAPADYRPSVRDPSTMRPMMVVRAGDAEPAPARLDISIEETKQPPQVLLNDDIANVEPSMPANASGTNGSSGEDSSAIPKAPAVPADWVLETDKRDELSVSVPDSAKINTEARPGDGAAAAVPAENTESISNEALASSQRLTGDSTPVVGSTPSKRSAPRLIVTALAGIALVSVVVVLRERVSSVKARAAQQPVHVEQGLSPSPAIAESQAVPVQGNVATAAAPENAAPERGAPEPANVDAVPAPVASAVPATKRVVLSLRPLDAKVYVRGHEMPGPPFEFDIAKGEHVAVEVVRFGFVTAKVVLDDKKPSVTFGMLRERWKK